MKKFWALGALAVLFGLMVWKLFFEGVSYTPITPPNKKRWAALARGTIDVPGGLLQIHAARDGVIENVAVSEGQHVAQGETLARQDETASRLAVAVAAGELAEGEAAIPLQKIRLDAGERELRRLETLTASHLATTQELAQAQDALADARAQLARQQAALATLQSKLDLARYEQTLNVIRSPVAGVVVHTTIQVGEVVNNQNFAPLFSIAPDARRIIRAEIEEESLSEIKVGQAAEIVAEMQKSPPVRARVTRLGLVFGSQKITSDEPSQKQDRHVVECFLELGNDAPSFLLGQHVLVRFLPVSSTGGKKP